MVFSQHPGAQPSEPWDPLRAGLGAGAMTPTPGQGGGSWRPNRGPRGSRPPPSWLEERALPNILGIPIQGPVKPPKAPKVGVLVLVWKWDLHGGGLADGTWVRSGVEGLSYGPLLLHLLESGGSVLWAPVLYMVYNGYIRIPRIPDWRPIPGNRRIVCAQPCLIGC